MESEQSGMNCIVLHKMETQEISLVTMKHRSFHTIDENKAIQISQEPMDKVFSNDFSCPNSYQIRSTDAGECIRNQNIVSSGYEKTASSEEVSSTTTLCRGNNPHNPFPMTKHGFSIDRIPKNLDWSVEPLTKSLEDDATLPNLKRRRIVEDSQDEVNISNNVYESVSRNKDESNGEFCTEGSLLNESTKRRKSNKHCHFNEHFIVIPIPMRHEFSKRMKTRLWSSLKEIQENAIRNTIEYAAEGWNWRTVVEDDQMIVCSKTGKLIHPVHL